MLRSAWGFQVFSPSETLPVCALGSICKFGRSHLVGAVIPMKNKKIDKKCQIRKSYIRIKE